MRLKGDDSEHQVKVEFAWYGTTSNKDKSGAYLFMPDKEATVSTIRFLVLLRLILPNSITFLLGCFFLHFMYRCSKWGRQEIKIGEIGLQSWLGPNPNPGNPWAAELKHFPYNAFLFRYWIVVQKIPAFESDYKRVKCMHPGWLLSTTNARLNQR